MKYEYKIIGAWDSEVHGLQAHDKYKDVPFHKLVELIANKYASEGWRQIELRGDIWLEREVNEKKAR